MAAHATTQTRYAFIGVGFAPIPTLRWVPSHGCIDVLGDSVKVGRRLRSHYVKMTIETHTQRLKVDHNGRLINPCTFKLRNA